MPTTKTKPDPDLAQMRADIEKITGKAVKATSGRRYLQVRLAELRRGVKVPRKKNAAASVKNQSVPVTVSLTRPRRDLLAKIADKTSQSASAVIARALEELAVKLGFGVDVQRARAVARTASAS